VGGFFMPETKVAEDTTRGLIEAMQAVMGGAVTTLISAGAGRLMFHSAEVRARRRKFLGPELVWEVPIAVGMAIIGEAVSGYFGLSPAVRTGVVAVLAYMGPRGAQALLMRFFKQGDL
jgi:hypothetical protein